ncbi:unnamed protein product [Ectocarpus sp. CCAP 1310/34]|nr:unnamed protein product [Ectocarpus sp. CCAP 1310/34]
MIHRNIRIFAVDVTEAEGVQDEGEERLASKLLCYQ